DDPLRLHPATVQQRSAQRGAGWRRTVLARTVQVAVESALRDRQFEDVRRLVDQITGYQKILGVRIFDPSGQLLYQSASLKGKPWFDPAELDQVLRERKAAHVHRQIDNAPVV